jgi:hypothetical protein
MGELRSDPPATRKITQSIPELISLAANVRNSPLPCALPARAPNAGLPEPSSPPLSTPLLSSKCPASSASHTTARSPLLCSGTLPLATGTKQGVLCCCGWQRLYPLSLSPYQSQLFFLSPRSKQPLVQMNRVRCLMGMETKDEVYSVAMHGVRWLVGVETFFFLVRVAVLARRYKSRAFRSTELDVEPSQSGSAAAWVGGLVGGQRLRHSRAGRTNSKGER